MKGMMKLRFMKLLALVLAVMGVTVSGLSAQATISSGRAIRIEIKGVPNDEAARVTGNYTVSDSGTIRLPLLSGPIRAAGLSPTSLAQSIEAAYRSAGIYTMPTINITATSEQDLETLVVTVGGQVQGPGPVKFYNGMTVWEAVQSARGSTPFGAMNRVRLMRGREVKEYDMNNPEHKNVKLQPRDTIEVPQKNAFGR